MHFFPAFSPLMPGPPQLQLGLIVAVSLDSRGMLEAEVDTGAGRGERARFDLSQAQVSPPEPEPPPQSQRPGPTGSHSLEGSVLPCLPLAPSRRDRKRPLTRSGPFPSGHLATCLMVCGVGKSQNIGLGRDSEVRWPKPSLLSIW